MDDVRRMIYGTLAVFVIGILIWIGYIYISACGFTTSCHKAAAIQPVLRTPIPTLLPATMPVALPAEQQPVTFDRCQVAATDLIGAWVNSEFPESQEFTFKDQNGLQCTASYSTDIQPLFSKDDLWFPGALACTTCHGAEVNTASAQFDMSSYEGILAGSRRESAEATGMDILGGGKWESSLLYEILYVRRFMPPGHPPELPAGGPVIFAGTPN